MNDVPRIISVDDHVIEPADLWSSRLPSRYQDRGPRIVRQRMSQDQATGGVSSWKLDDDGDWADVWYYDDVVAPLTVNFAAVGFDELGFKVATYDQYQPGAWKQKERLEAMDANHVDAALCFPNTLPRFCGQTFSERKDKELALLCIRAYNDWMIDDWSAGAGRGRLLPLTIVPLWDADLAAAEVHRCAGKGSFAVAFAENPHPLGFPSIHDKGGFWNPFFQACQYTGTVVCMHIGSSSKMPSTAPDAPFIISSTLTFQNAMGSVLDYIFSGTLARFPSLTIAYSEGQVGWMPYIFERADKLWEERSDNSFGTWLPDPPSSYIPGRVYGCIFDDATGLANRDRIGMDQICFETDYPHADSTFPNSKEVLTAICAEAEMSDDEVYKLARGNAIRAFGLERFGISA
ncbi:MAG: amidohydrolase family protein [Acidimicrobiales bacterium]|jgi:predicted TIM-barrel fold metal-dependent hydrolase